MTDTRRNRLLWHCRRGMLELDLIPAKVVDRYLDHFTDAELNAFERLLEFEDTILFDYLHGHDDPADAELKQLVAKFRQ